MSQVCDPVVDAETRFPSNLPVIIFDLLLDALRSI
jgi:hypothetical protein